MPLFMEVQLDAGLFGFDASLENLMALYTSTRITNVQRTFWSMNGFMNPALFVLMSSEADASSIERLRSEAKQSGKTVPSLTAIAIKAAALTMQRHPEANQAILGMPFFRRLCQFHNIDISVAIEKDFPSMPGQAMASVLRDTTTQSLADITAELQRLRTCTVENDATLREFMSFLKYMPWPLSTLFLRLPYYFPKFWVKYRGCACWVNAPSKAGVDMTVTCWPWPVTFSFGFVKERPRVVDGQVVVARTIPLIMAFDRRIMGGGPGSRVLMTFQHFMENTELLG